MSVAGPRLRADLNPPTDIPASFRVPTITAAFRPPGTLTIKLLIGFDCWQNIDYMDSRHRKSQKKYYPAFSGFSFSAYNDLLGFPYIRLIPNTI